MHESDKNANPIAEPHSIIVDEYERILNTLKDPPKALSIAVTGDKIFIVNIDEKAADIINTMNENCFTYVPVMHEGKFFGVFSENTLFTYLVKNEVIILDSNTTLEEFKDVLAIDKHNTEIFRFISRNTTVYEVDDLFKQCLSDQKRLAAVFITENGLQHEKLLGLITAWDVTGC